MNDQVTDLLSELAIASIQVDEKNMIKYCNTHALQFLAAADQYELIGKPLHHFICCHPIIASMQTLATEMKQTEESMSRYYEEEKGLYYIVGKFKNNDDLHFVIQDRTSKQQYERLLFDKQQLESVSHLAAGVAHELRNPLSVIQGFIQLSSITGDLSKYYETIMTEIERMNHFIDDFLSVSRKKVTKKRIVPEELLKSVLKLIRSECLLHGITLDYQFFTADGYVYVNEGLFKQVLLNLLRNAIEAYEGIDKKRYFRLHAGQEGNQFILCIEDFGPGMSEQVRAQLGKPFFTTKEKGTGIGIPLCQKIIKDHDGRFIIDSEPGKGTKITIMLPLE